MSSVEVPVAVMILVLLLVGACLVYAGSVVFYAQPAGWAEMQRGDVAAEYGLDRGGNAVLQPRAAAEGASRHASEGGGRH